MRHHFARAIRVGQRYSAHAALFVTALSFLYAIGDYMGWWDELSGRSTHMRTLDRISSPEGFPKSWIYRDEPEFESFKRFILKRSPTADIAVLRRAKADAIPNASIVLISRGDISFPVTVPPTYPVRMYVPEVSPVLLIIGDLHSDKSVPHGKAAYAGSLADVRRWISDEKNSERFISSTVLFGLLGVVVAFLKLPPSKEHDNRTPEE